MQDQYDGYDVMEQQFEYYNGDNCKVIELKWFRNNAKFSQNGVGMEKIWLYQWREIVGLLRKARWLNDWANPRAATSIVTGGLRDCTNLRQPIGKATGGPTNGSGRNSEIW